MQGRQQKKLRAEHLKDIDYKSYKCYTQSHSKTKSMPTEKYRIQKGNKKRKSYLQGHPESGKYKFKRENSSSELLKED